MSSPYLKSFRHWQQFKGASCLNKYSTYKKEIEEKINDCYRSTNPNFYTQWHQLNEQIKQKNNEIKNCAQRNGLSLDLLEDDKIKSFSALCPNISSCRTKPLSLVKNQASLRPDTKGTCKGESCHQKSTRIKSPKAKTQLIPPRESSNTISSPNLETKNPVEVHPERKESEQPSVPSQSHQDSKHRVSPVKTEVGSSEPLDIQNPKKPQLEQASAQSESLPEPVTTTELSNHQVSHSSSKSASEEFDATSSSQEIDLKGITHQSGISADQTSYDNLHRLQPIKGIADGKQDPDNETVPVGIKDGLSPPGNVMISTNVGGENLARTSMGDVTSKKVNEIDANNGNILHTLSEFFNGIPNNPEIIKTSAPIGIALLLGLLFKVN
ncbi:hypothetical protein PVIIG_05718 [Plasmodium vivax India VII]|uniref:Variable surface protein Vir18 n=1 Tax=Plasmodium vivax India VII TaxID=1077284 RepID=A0A0J9S1T7_PLAVI|nr:hypothetical protein PVIIG_05718 [Plasmodium vivax India VII]